MIQRLSLTEKCLSVATRVRPGEGNAVLLLILNAFLLLYSHYLLKVVRESLILANGTALDKSLATALSALTVGLAVFIYTLFYKKFQTKPHRYVLTRMVNGFFFINILLFMGLITFEIRTPMIFYIWQSIYGVLLISHFWSFCADLMNQKTGKRLFPPIMIGATLGAWIGSLSADWVYSLSGLPGIFLAALCCLFFATQLSQWAEAKLPEDSKNHRILDSEVNPNQSVLDGFRLILNKRYLLLIACLVILMNWINTTGEFIFASYVKDAASAAVAADSQLDAGELIAHYYSTYYTWISLLGFLMQTFLVARVFIWIGIKGSVLVLPVVMILGYGLLAFISVFVVARLVLVVENSTSYSIANTTRNALFLPLDREEKYLGKTTIDTFCWRLGDFIQFGVIYLTVNNLNWHTQEFIGLNLLLSFAMLGVCWQISRHYQEKKAANREGNAPVLKGEPPAFDLCSGWVMRGKISEELFYDADPGDAFRYYLTTLDGKKLPRWIKFDHHNLAITFSPPAGASGEMSLNLKVTDSDELSCETPIKIRWSSDLTMSDELIRLGDSA